MSMEGLGRPTQQGSACDTELLQNAYEAASHTDIDAAVFEQLAMATCRLLSCWLLA